MTFNKLHSVAQAAPQITQINTEKNLCNAVKIGGKKKHQIY